MALPNPFQSSTLPSPILNVPPKTTQNDTTLFHGYRSNFDINQQKQEYEERIKQQAQQQVHFHRNVQPQRINRNEKPNYIAESNNYCELCECNFKYPQQLQKHLSQHEKCWYDNCTFEGSSKLLQKHVETQHQSGIFQRIVKIETEEDIEKWREERRKRYPTKANIEARRLAQEERLKRGERIQEPNHRFGSTQNRKSAHQHSFTQNERSHNSSKTSDKKKNDRKRRRTRNKHKDDQIKSTPNDKIVSATSDSVKSDAATIEQCPASPKEKTVPTTNALATIMGMYGTDSDSDDCDDDAAAAATATTTTTLSENKQPDNKQEEHVCIITDDNVTAASDPISVAIESNKHSVVVDELMENRKRSACTDDELPIKQLKIDSSEQTKSIDQGNENESDNDAPEEQPIQRQTNDLREKLQPVCGPTEIQKPYDKRKIEKIPKKKTILDMTKRIRNQNTLLEKLLQKDIRHERNVLLQCVRYVVENNFFGIGQKTDVESNQIENS